MEPAGLGLFKVYAAIMTALYAFLVLISLAVPFMGLELAAEDTFTCLVMGLFSFPFMLVFAYAFFLPRAKWAWVFGTVLIALGLGSCCFWPICIPLLIKWIDPACRSWFETGPDDGPSLGTDGW